MEVYGYDSVIVKRFENKPYVFARSQSNDSHLYWSSIESDSSSSPWKMIGGSKNVLKTDVSVAYNTLTKVQKKFLKTKKFDFSSFLSLFFSE